MASAMAGLCRRLTALRLLASVSKNTSTRSLTTMPTTAAWGVPEADTEACTVYAVGA